MAQRQAACGADGHITIMDRMKLDSPLFDGVRVKPDEDRRLRATSPICQWPGCAGAATHRAPKGRLREGQYWRFCLDHVREYNQSYNFFAGMSDDAVARFQKDSLTGHLPTWKMGVNGKPVPGVDAPDLDAAVDPMGLFREFGGRLTRWGLRSRRPARRSKTASRSW